jgi:predicted nucleic acid-binding protein
MLDTNIVPALVRQPQGTAALRAAALDQTEVCTSIIVAAEVRFGVGGRVSRRLPLASRRARSGAPEDCAKAVLMVIGDCYVTGRMVR